MSNIIFNKVDYTLNSLIAKIDLGEIALPDIQRPFVWKNAKVRDLLDSMYRGYPVGYLLFWKSETAEKFIGIDKKQKTADLLIVDGQQRLTSLYAVLKGVPVVRNNYEKEQINIAFNPLDEKFEVADAAILNDKTFISDISIIWSENSNTFKVVENYVSQLKEIRNINEEELTKIQNAITKLDSVKNFPFTALELASNISEEDISEVFVRINSTGKSLNQADFILTLMSVFWDEGRDELEKFCYNSRNPSKKESSPFNNFIEPDPDQLLRVGVGLGFKRARLRHIHSILRGKDLETGIFSVERREQQFAILKKAQKQVLDIQHWHDFMKCLKMAGFRSGKMISSDINLLFSYTLYLIGRTEYMIEEFKLRKTIAQWFFMSAVKGRFSASPESAMESDLSSLRYVSDAEQFLKWINRECQVALTSDFWDITLPHLLATSSPRSPSLFAYDASLVLLEAPALYSSIKLSDHFDPTDKANKSSVERHHLFPKGYLKKMGITKRRDTDQIANYAYVEWLDNLKISDQAPTEYTHLLKDRFNQNALEMMLRLHALPVDWENMEYNIFLEKRRVLIAQIIKEGYYKLVDSSSITPMIEQANLSDILKTGETETVEFKSTLRINLHTRERDKKIEMAVLKTIAGFLNTNGGTLIIGVADDGTLVGIEEDGFSNEDKMNLHLINLIKSNIDEKTTLLIHSHFEDYEDGRVMSVKCDRSPYPIFVKDAGQEKFYVRMGPSTDVLPTSQLSDYLKNRFE